MFILMIFRHGSIFLLLDMVGVVSVFNCSRVIKMFDQFMAKTDVSHEQISRGK